MFDMVGVLSRRDAFEDEVTVGKSVPRRSSLTDATRLKRGFHAPGLSGIMNGTSQYQAVTGFLLRHTLISYEFTQR
jgi:hypothetical protein